MSAGFFFGGRRYVSPVVASAVDESAMFNVGTTVSNKVAILGESSVGIPNKVYTVGSPSAARAILGSGDLLRAIEKAFDPSAQTGGPAEVKFMRVGSPTRAALSLVDGDGTAVINIKATDYGAIGNTTVVRSQHATNTGKLITVKRGQQQFQKDDIDLAPLAVAYTGAGSTPRVQITSAGEMVLRVSGTVVATIVLSDYATVADLAAAVSAVADWTGIDNGNSSQVSPVGLFDVKNSTDVVGNTNVYATNYAVVAWLNSTAGSLVTATLGLGKEVSNTAGYAALTGGTSPAVTAADWQAGFDALQAEDVQWVVPVSGSDVVHSMASAHVSYMSTIGQMERRAICGTALATTDTSAAAKALALNSDRVGLVHLGMYDFSAQGVLTLYPPYILAAQVAGMFAGTSPGSTATNKALKVQGFERELSRPDTDALIDAGVIPFHKSRRGFLCTMAVSTWRVNNNFNRVQLSCGVALDYTARSVREAVEELLGEKGNAQNLGSVYSRAESALMKLSVPEPVGPGVLAGDEDNPPWRGLTVRLEGDAFIVEFECSPVIPMNYGGVVIHAVPYSATVSA